MQFDPRHKHLALLPPMAAEDAAGAIAIGRDAFRAGDAFFAYACWKSAADEGDNEARFLVGTLLALGGSERTPNERAPDLERAFQFLAKSTVEGNARAAFNAGLVRLCYSPDIAVALAFLSLAVEMTDDSKIVDRVHRLSGALRKSLPEGAGTPMRGIMDRIMRGDPCLTPIAYRESAAAASLLHHMR